MNYNARHSSAVFLILVISRTCLVASIAPHFLDPEGRCSITGHLLSCYRSSRASHILKNLHQYVREDTVVQEISVVESNLTEIPVEIWTDCPSLQSLDLSGNSITLFNPGIRHPHLQYLNLSQNGRMDHLDLEAVFYHYPSLVSIDLSWNQIEFLGQKKPVTSERRTVIILREANVTCANETLWFLEWTASEILRPNRRIVVDEARCSSGPMDGVPLSQSFSSLSALNHPTCLTCDCFFKPSLYVNCSDRGLIAFPKGLPVQTKVVNLEHNHIREISLTPEWTSVIYLHLKDNRIESLNGLEGNAFARNIRSLNLESNRLSEVQARVLKQLNVDQINLKDNPWRCDCNTIAFQLWIQDHSTQIRDMDQIKCTASPTPGKANGIDADIRSSKDPNPMLSGRRIYKILRSDLCPQQLEGAAYHFYDLASGTMAFLTVFIICKLVYDWWWQKRTGKLPRFFKLNV